MGCTKIIYDLLPEKLFMGYGEEQLSRTLTFDISQMQAELPGGVPMIAYMRPRDELGYLASGVTLDGSTLTWELSAHVMQYKGIGGAQIVLVDESVEETHILKSHVMQMLIGSSIPLTGGEPPEPWETWLEQILAAAARAESAAADAEAQADRAETAEAGAQQALIDAGSPVLYGRTQTLTDAQQQTARGNIAAASAADVSDLKSAVDAGLETQTVLLATTDFTSSVVIDTITGDVKSNSAYKVLKKNLHDLLPPGVVSVKLVPASGKRVILTGFSQAPSLTVGDNNLAIIVSNLSGKADETVEAALDSEVYYVVQTNDSSFNAVTATVWSGAAVKDSVSSLQMIVEKTLEPYKSVWVSGGVGGTGGLTVSENRIRDKAAEAPVANKGDIVIAKSPYKVRLAAYNSNTLNTTTFVAWNSTGFEGGVLEVPEEFAGYKIVTLIQNSDHPSDDISAEVEGISEFVKYIHKNKKLLEGKTVAILGDSISTNGNSIATTDHNAREIIIQEEDVGVELSAYLTYDDVNSSNLSLGGHTYTSSEIGTEVTFTPLAEDVGKTIGRGANYNDAEVTTWWEVMQDALGNDTIPVCWSGSSITDHEKDTLTRATSWAFHPAQIRKCGRRIPGTMDRIAPDIIIIYRGTNDFSHSPYALLTEDYFDSYNWQYPTTDEVDGGYGFLEGIALTVQRLREAYPNAQIYLCTLNVFKRINYDHFPTNNGINSLPQYNAAIRKAADFFGCGLIDFEKDGITFENCYSSGYITDSADHPTHPTDKGHKTMGLKAIADIRAQYNDLG